jgi:hypothetical protein
MVHQLKEAEVSQTFSGASQQLIKLTDSPLIDRVTVTQITLILTLSQLKPTLRRILLQYTRHFRIQLKEIYRITFKTITIFLSNRYLKEKGKVLTKMLLLMSREISLFLQLEEIILLEVHRVFQ